MLVLTCLVAFGLVSCEDVVSLETPPGKPQMQVEGWLYDDTSYQEVKLSWTTSYFDTTQPPPINDARLYITDLRGARLYRLERHPQKPGVYFVNNLKPVVGGVYQLDIYRDFEHFTAVDQLKRVAPIDSLSFRFRGADVFRENDTWELTVWARDIPGRGDNFKINVINNGKLLNTYEDINVFNDQATDGLVLIPPVNQSLNRLPFKALDRVQVRMISLSPAAYAFWLSMSAALNNRGLFATPPNNTISNVFNVNDRSPTKAIGFFGCSAVSKRSRTVTFRQEPE